MQLLIGTTNKGKFGEIREVLHHLPLHLLTPQEIHITEKPAESGANYEENARLKCNFYFEKSNRLPTLAEDSGIEIAAFPGELGFKTRRWGAGENAGDEEWLTHFLAELKKHPDELHRATFICTAALKLPDADTIRIFHGKCPGRLLTSPQTTVPHGIPLSACFVPEGFDKVYAALTPEEKNGISHRGQAIHQVREFLSKSLIPSPNIS
jgi:XTP/dITP diphosphohydrolase